MVGPAVEPALSVHQTAKQGGDCGINIRRFFAHLDPETEGAEDGDIAAPLWNAVLGPAAVAIDSL
eukprot:9339064-Lingulodinium_polyedra.AAC.1